MCKGDQQPVFTNQIKIKSPKKKKKFIFSFFPYFQTYVKETFSFPIVSFPLFPIFKHMRITHLCFPSFIISFPLFFYFSKLQPNTVLGMGCDPFLSHTCVVHNHLSWWNWLSQVIILSFQSINFSFCKSKALEMGRIDWCFGFIQVTLFLSFQSNNYQLLSLYS